MHQAQIDIHPPIPQPQVDKKSWFNNLISKIQGILTQAGSFFSSPQFLKWFWFFLFNLAIFIPIYNYLEFNPATHNIWAWAAWAGSLAIALVIYRVSGSRSSNKRKKNRKKSKSPKTPERPPEPDKNGKYKGDIKYIILTILLVLALIFYKVIFYKTSIEFKHHWSQVKQIDCNYYKKAFLQNYNKTIYSNSKFIPKLENPTLKEEKDGIHCSMPIKKPQYEILNFITWLVIMSDYIGATNAGVILASDKAIEARAIWIPIYVPWHTQSSYSQQNSLEHITNGSISCINSEARLVKKISDHKSPSSSFIVNTSLKEVIDNDEHKIIKAIVETSLILKQLEKISFSSKEISISFDSKVLPKLREEGFYQYICIEDAPEAINDKQTL